MQKLLTVILQGSTIALIVASTRWLFIAKGPSLPRLCDGSNVYEIKWQWRAVGFVGGAFWIVLSIWSWYDLGHVDRTMIAMTLIFVAFGVWIASGSATTNQDGIAKKGLWRSRSFRWSDITEIRLLKKQGGAIEIRAGSEKIVIDSRFVACQHLLQEIEERTQLQTIKASS